MSSHMPGTIWADGDGDIRLGVWRDDSEKGPHAGQLVLVTSVVEDKVTYSPLTVDGSPTREYMVQAKSFDGWMTDSCATDHRWHVFVADDFDPVALADKGAWPGRRFVLQRDADITGISGTGIVADGVCWPDSTVSIRWRGERPSVVFWEKLEHARAIHGHGGATRFVWLD